MSSLAGTARTHPAVAAWRRAGGRGAPLAVRPIKARGGKEVVRLEGAALAGGGGRADVIAKLCPRGDAEREIAVYERVLPRLPLPAPHLLAHVPEGTGAGREPGAEADGRTWLFLEDAGGVPYDPRSARHRALAGRWLAALHAFGTSRDAAGRLPRRDAAWHRGVAARARSALDAALRNPAARSADAEPAARLLARCERLLDDWDERAALLRALPERVVHGDLWPDNVRVRPGSRGLELAPFDWGSAGWGAPATDIAAVGPAAYRAGAAALGERPPTPALEAAAAVGATLRVLAAVPGEAPSLASPWPGRALRKLAHYEAQLARGEGARRA